MSVYKHLVLIYSKQQKQQSNIIRLNTVKNYCNINFDVYDLILLKQKELCCLLILLSPMSVYSLSFCKLSQQA